MLPTSLPLTLCFCYFSIRSGPLSPKHLHLSLAPWQHLFYSSIFPTDLLEILRPVRRKRHSVVGAKDGRRLFGMNADWPSQLWPPLVMRFVLLIRLMQFNEAGYRNSWHGHGATTRQNYHCYSCMTKEFETNWNNLERIYYRPRNFTDHCLSLPRNANIGIAPCPHSVCVSVVEPRILAGTFITFSGPIQLLLK